VKNDIGRTWRFRLGDGRGGRGVRRGRVGGRPRPAVLRIAERGRRNILIPMNFLLIDYRSASRRYLGDWKPEV
jgi:hypothetical protein